MERNSGTFLRLSFIEIGATEKILKDMPVPNYLAIGMIFRLTEKCPWIDNFEFNQALCANISIMSHS
jgi:hypothetical protein